MNKTKKFYICGIDLQHELGETQITVYPSIDSLKENMDCTEECGIVEITITPNQVKWLKEQDLFKKVKKKPYTRPKE